MIKSVEHIIAASLVIGALSGNLPINSFILGLTEA
ncbi:MAG: hypothetical protein A370_04752 [Clostridium sp. Maddingley MBC34-26]|nr:MAG: hypothetical protein A370_04752 [Clostridium sp. Maddingley MBC34-26]